MSRSRGGLISRMVLATGALLLIVGAAFCFLLISISEQRTATHMTRHAQQVFDIVDDTEQRARDAQTTQLQYLATGDPRYVAGWQAATADLPRATGHLEQIATTAQEQRHAQRIDQLAQSFVDDYSAPVMDAAQRGDPSPQRAATIQEGDRRIAELHAEAQALRMTERQIVATRDARTDRMFQQEIFAVVAGLAGSALVIALVGWYQTRTMVQPIRRVAAMADQLASGDLSTRLPETGTVEVGRLERFFNVMAASLERGYRELTERVDTQSALRRIATLVARGVPPAEVTAAVAAELGQLIDTESVRIVRFEADGTGTVVASWGGKDLELPVGTRVPLDGGSVTAMVLRTGRSARVDDFTEATGTLAAHLRGHGIRAAVGAPIHVEGRLWGAVVSATPRDEPPSRITEARLAEYTDLIGTAIANTQARADLLASRARFVHATDQARRRIERDLHDGIQQRLISLGLDLRRVQEDVPAELSGLREELSAAVAGLTGTVDDVRELSRGVHPAILSEGGLRPALCALARRSSLPVELKVRLDGRLPEPVEVAAYYVVAEALTNAAKHAQANAVSVQADVRDHQLRLEVRDDGVGGANPGHGSGLIGLADRVEALGGTLKLDSPQDCGTCLEVRLPLDEAATPAGEPTTG